MHRQNEAGLAFAIRIEIRKIQRRIADLGLEVQAHHKRTFWGEMVK